MVYHQASEGEIRAPHASVDDEITPVVVTGLQLHVTTCRSVTLPERKTVNKMHPDDNRK